MWIPDALYKSLPAVYAAAGVACLSAFDWNGPAGVSAAVLIAAGATITSWRVRAALARRRRHLRYMRPVRR